MMAADSPSLACLPFENPAAANTAYVFTEGESASAFTFAARASQANSSAAIKPEGGFGSNPINGWVRPQRLYSINDSAPIEIGKSYTLNSTVDYSGVTFNSPNLDEWLERDLIRLRASEDLLLAVRITSIGTINPTDRSVEIVRNRFGRVPEPGVILGIHAGQRISSNPSELQNTSPLSSSNPNTRIGYFRQTSSDGRIVGLNESFTTIRIPKGFSTISVDKFGPWLNNYQVEFVATNLAQRSVIPLEVGRFQATHGNNDGRATFRLDNAENVELRVIQSPANPIVPGRTWVITHGNLQNASATNTTPEIARLIAAVQQRVGSQDTIVALNWGDEAAFQLPAQQASVWLKPIGKQLGLALHQLGVRAPQANYIGFSYGTHINFFAANELNQLSRSGKAESMWALDPAAFRPDSLLPGVSISDSRFYQQKDINLKSVATSSYAIHTDTGQALGVKVVQNDPGNKNALTAAFGSRLISATADHQVELRLADDSILAPTNVLIGNRLRMHAAPLEFFIFANSSNSPGAVTSQFRIGRTAPTLRGGELRLTARIDFNNSGALPRVIPLALLHKGSSSRVSEAGELLVDSNTRIAAFNGALKKRDLDKRSVFNAVRAAGTTGNSVGPIRDFLGIDDERDLHVLRLSSGNRQIRVMQDSPSQVDVPLINEFDLVLYSAKGNLISITSANGSQLQRGMNFNVPREGGFMVIRVSNGKVDTRSFVADTRYEINVR